MSSTGMLALSPAPFGTDTSASVPSETLSLCPTDDPLGLGLDLGNTLPLQLSWNGQAGIAREHLCDPGNSSSARKEEDQQKPGRSGKPSDTKRDPRARIKQNRYSSSETSITIPNHQTKFSRREQHLERNRIAASNCRQRKRERTQHLETRFREEAQKKGRLKHDITALRSEILGLKDEILKHALCEDGLIGRHLGHVMQNAMQSNATAGASSLSASSPVSDCLRMTASPAGLSDESLLNMSCVDKRVSGDMNGEILSLALDASWVLADDTT